MINKSRFPITGRTSGPYMTVDWRMKPPRPCSSISPVGSGSCPDWEALIPKSVGVQKAGWRVGRAEELQVLSPQCDSRLDILGYDW